MVNEANRTDQPDFTAMTVPERSQWLLAQLRKLPGKIVVNDEGRWLHLDATGKLVGIVATLAGGLSEEQFRTCLRWMREQDLRVAQNDGGGKYSHLIKLEDEDAAP